MAQVTSIEISSLISKIKELNSEEIYLESFSIFLKLITNIINSPSEEKFKSIKKSNKIISEKWSVCKGIEELSKLVGYEDLDENMLIFAGEIENLMILKEQIEAVTDIDKHKKSLKDLHSATVSHVASHNNLIQVPSESTPIPEPEKQDLIQESAEKVVIIEKKQEEAKIVPRKEETKKKIHEVKPAGDLKDPDYRLEWSGSSYSGPIKDGWFEGKGRFRFPSGVIYEGDFHKGEFHGKGTLIFPNGGKYKASWDRGRAVDGEYEYYDGLIYDSQNWNYCQIPDRRFYTEIKEGLRPAGATLLVNDARGPKAMVPGTYDVGDGYFDLNKNMVFDYDGEEIGPPEDADLREILDKYRYNPSSL